MIDFHLLSTPHDDFLIVSEKTFDKKQGEEIIQILHELQEIQK